MSIFESKTILFFAQHKKFITFIITFLLDVSLIMINLLLERINNTNVNIIPDEINNILEDISKFFRHN